MKMMLCKHQNESRESGGAANPVIRVCRPSRGSCCAVSVMLHICGFPQNTMTNKGPSEATGNL